MPTFTPEQRKAILSTAWDYLVITIGALLYAFSWSDMMIPNGIASGGLTGACAILGYATGIPVHLTYIASNAVLLLVGFLILGKGFGFKTIYAIAVSSLFMDVLSIESLFVFFESKLLLVIVAGTVESIGLTFIIERGGSTGGTDILALIINKFWPISLGRVFIAVDLFVIASILLVPGKTVEDMVYGYVAMIIFSVMVDWVMIGRNASCKVLVFSEKYAEIADHILHKMDRGVTALDAVGWYTGTERKVLLILMRKREVHDLTLAIKHIDPRAFVSVSPANTVYGEGFDEIKTGVPIKLKKKGKDGNDPQ